MKYLINIFMDFDIIDANKIKNRININKDIVYILKNIGK